jgi:hypothetical protein
VSFHGTDQAYRLFQRRDFDRPNRLPIRLPETAKSVKTPRFLVRRESALRSFLACVIALCARPKLPASKNLKYLYRDASLTGFRPPGMGFANSLLLHCALILGLIYVPMALPTRAPGLSAAFLPPEVIYYSVPQHRPDSHLPRIAPRGPGGRPGSGIHPNVAPDSGKTISNGNLTVISKPLHPDNFHQTIVQPISPPDLRIPNDVKLPNLSLGAIAAPNKPMIDLSIKKPTHENVKQMAEVAVPLAETHSDHSFTTALQPANTQPALPIPTSPLARPMRLSGGVMDTTGSEAPEMGAAGDGRAILAIGIDPSGGASGLAVPPGNRWGDFSIAPGEGNSGSPGGRPGGAPGGGGSAGNGRAGDASVGLGPGHEGGGGGKDGSSSRLSIQGTGTGTGGIIGMLDPHLVAGMVYPVGPLRSKLFRNRMVVSAGPMGGGGLGVYGALPCSKIYTIFLPMNNASWTMQYCQKATASPEAPEADARSTVIRMETGLVPPDPDLESRFDFKRMAVPPGKAQKLIVLKGILREDGTVDALQVYQGIVPQMDEAARLAFSRWKFRPAMRAGKPVAIEVLVGISPDIVTAGESQ